MTRIGLTLACLALSLPAEAAEPRRFALLLANDDGGAGTEQLRFTRADAEKVGAVLTELGGYRASDVHYLFDADADAARAKLATVEGAIAEAEKAGVETSLLFYYSGHARDGALRLGASRWPMAELRAALSRSRAGVRLGILDACQSGAITRAKGGRPGPSFLFSPDEGRRSRGMVLISSSSEDEDSQESDQLGGSYFTHYLVSGLRGDADESGDQRVSLAEVYGYAYHKTIARTVDTRAGAQHPTYRYDLEGSGDLVLTELSQSKAALAFSAELEGEYLLFDPVRAQVAAELKKEPGRARRIALAPGRYLLKKRLPDHLRVLELELGASGEQWVDEARMTSMPFDEPTAKGGGLGVGVSARAVVQTHLSDRARAELFPPLFLLGAAIELRELAGASLGLELLLGAQSGAPLQLPGEALSVDFFEATVALEMVWSFELGDTGVSALLGPRVAGVYLRRSFDEALALPAQDHFTLSPMGVTGLRYTHDRLNVELTVRGGLLPFSVDDNRALFYVEGGLAIGVALR